MGNSMVIELILNGQKGLEEVDQVDQTNVMNVASLVILPEIVRRKDTGPLEDIAVGPLEEIILPDEEGDIPQVQEEGADIPRAREEADILQVQEDITAKVQKEKTADLQDTAEVQEGIAEVQGEEADILQVQEDITAEVQKEKTADLQDTAEVREGDIVEVQGEIVGVQEDTVQ